MSNFAAQSKSAFFMATTFRHFLDKFPKVNLPQTLSEEDARIYSKDNEPLPDKLIQEFILPNDTEVDDLTEFVPCFKLADTKDFHAVVYWKAGLMNYQYTMLTFDKSGKAIDKKTLAGTISNGIAIVRSVARIDNDMSIYIMSGHTDRDETHFDAAESTTVELELLPDGKMMELA